MVKPLAFWFKSKRPIEVSHCAGSVTVTSEVTTVRPTAIVGRIPRDRAVEIRGRRIGAKVVPTPFYKRPR